VAYATQADIEAIYSADALAVAADRDGDGVADPASVAAALERASSEIDLHIGARYALPLASTPVQLVQIAVDIALYRLVLDAGVRTDEHRTRYEDAVAMLRRIADGKAALTLPPDPLADPDDPTLGQGPQPIVISGPPRLFSRDTTRDL